MKFHNLALTGWSYEKADKEIPMALLAEQGLPRSIQSRNPVPGTWVYSDDSQWRERLSDNVNQAVAMSGIAAEDIQGFMGVHNGYKLHPEPAGPAVMGA
ncbi:MAG: hypothetical protein IH840_15065, partial [Candidatus Heimdallarchaeota archaeon]|nr:hypothetical protein [Candidatus Heimdallarchaeota archaeon]